MAFTLKMYAQKANVILGIFPTVEKNIHLQATNFGGFKFNYQGADTRNGRKKSFFYRELLEDDPLHVPRPQTCEISGAAVSRAQNSCNSNVPPYFFWKSKKQTHIYMRTMYSIHGQG